MDPFSYFFLQPQAKLQRSSSVKCDNPGLNSTCLAKKKKKIKLKFSISVARNCIFLRGSNTSPQAGQELQTITLDVNKKHLATPHVCMLSRATLCSTMIKDSIFFYFLSLSKLEKFIFGKGNCKSSFKTTA